jgi:site-specific DNA-methyltransferase (adenine-specific)
MAEPYYSDESVTLYHGDCLDVLRELPDNSVDAVATDPPYGLEFMGREWDGADGFRRSLNAADAGRDNVFGRTSRTSPEYRALHTFQEWCQEWATECLRILKPGGHLLAFGGSRTWHRLTAAVEDAGFEIRDSIAWLYGSGFPKSLDVPKAIDKAAGAERTIVGRDPNWRARVHSDSTYDGGQTRPEFLTAPATEAAEQWQGWGTALKPAFEPIVVARKPLPGTVAANVLEHGTGALNIDATRIHTPGSEGKPYTVKRLKPGATLEKTGGTWRPDSDQDLPWESGREYEGHTKDGRWPTNVVLDESQAAELDKQTGPLTSGSRAAGTYGLMGYMGADASPMPAISGDSGGASRFFPVFRYEAKAPTSERPRDGETAHPTVKPLDLMRWLVRLVTPPGGTILEPFAGSGTTAEACVIEGFNCIAIEREADYLPLIVNRLSKPIQIGLDFEEPA